MERLLQLLVSLFNTKIKRIILLVFVLFSIISIVFDNIPDLDNSYEDFFGTIGISGGAIYFGCLLLRTKHFYGFRKWQVYGFAAMNIISGGIMLSLYLFDKVLVILGA